ncbi:MAG: SUMF1/EgtB/PvdO family nonheme iron enzyme [Clostridia bacterium]|nr:SUMF1/EgtB/PvdO family nonheme iron enzyme [Clostridia bacterium]
MRKSRNKSKIKENVALKSSQGITLITLVITIILLIILAGIAINLSIGENGLFKMAKEARNKYLQSEKDEEKVLNELYKELGMENLPENTKENPQEIGKEVALKDSWGMQTVTYTSTKDGKEVKDVTKVATVYAISVGNGETVPVPKGFWYVGGNLENGVIISDNIEDRYGYNPETKKEDETTLDKTTHEYAEKLKGNQFVWIPCTIQNYKKNTNWNGTTQKSGTFASTNWDTSTNTAEETQIEKYGGFYVARYEAGTSNIQGIDFSSNHTCTESWITPNISYSKAIGNITSKANEIPYYHADYYTAVEMSKRMYKNDNERNKYVNSGLITGTMWDVMLKTMNEKTSCSTISGNWGNYYDNKVTNARGKLTYIKDSSGSDKGSNTVWEDNTSKNNTKTTIGGVNYWKLLSTGSTDEVQKMHIYDVSGNLWEWTQETAFQDTKEKFILRGGSFYDSYANCPACFRACSSETDSYTTFGFRPVLYIK